MFSRPTGTGPNDRDRGFMLASRTDYNRNAGNVLIVDVQGVYSSRGSSTHEWVLPPNLLTTIRIMKPVLPTNPTIASKSAR